MEHCSLCTCSTSIWVETRWGSTGWRDNLVYVGAACGTEGGDEELRCVEEMRGKYSGNSG